MAQQFCFEIYWPLQWYLKSNCFLGELKTPKRHEINWSLDNIKISNFYYIELEAMSLEKKSFYFFVQVNAFGQKINWLKNNFLSLFTLLEIRPWRSWRPWIFLPWHLKNVIFLLECVINIFNCFCDRTYSALWEISTFFKVNFMTWPKARVKVEFFSSK